ncbi:MAG: restriction endonuclease subunit S [Candidatus Bathyarchaeota archaeon]|nr:restriction endonuclease subunit S [Candidatus Bathyarchaeota archaeon]
MTAANPSPIACSQETPLPLYKETNFTESSIGKVPEDWRVASLETVAEIRGNKGMKAADKIAFIPMESVPDVQAFVKYALRKKEDIRSFTYCEAGDLLLAKITPSLENGKQGIVPLDVPDKFAFATTEVFPIHALDIDTLYLFYVLKHPKFRNKIISSMIGTTGRQRASKESLQRLEIPLPSMNEQKAIAKLLSNVDCAIELADRIIAQTERLKRGLMQQLLTRGIGHTETKQTPIGQIPENWTIVKLADIARVERGKFAHRPRNEPRFYGGKYPFIQTGDIASAKGLIKTYTQTLNEEGLEISRMFKKGTIVISIAGNIGDVGMLYFDACFPDSVIGITPCGEVDSFFLMYLLQYLQHDISAKAPRSTQKNINLDIIKPIKIPLPPLSEQQKISSILTEIGKKLEIEVNEKAKLENIKRGLMDLLLTGKVRIKVD